MKARQSVDLQAGTSPVQGMPAVLPGTPLPIPEGPPDVLWSVPITAAPITSPLIAGEYVVLSHLPGIIAAHRAADGERVWQADLNPEQRLVADDTMLYVASGEAIHALRLTDGAVAWRAPAGTLTAPLLAQDGWVIAASGGRLMALRTSDGTAVWTIEAPPQREAASIAGNVLFVPSTDGYIRARDLATGKAIWEERLGGAPGEPLVVGDRLYLGAADKALYCLSAGTGRQEWRFPVGASIRGRPAADGVRVFITALDNMVRAYDLGHGAQRWQFGLNFRPLTGPVVAGSTVFIVSPNNDVRMLRATDGSTAGVVGFPEKLAVAPAMRESDFGVAIAAVTGSLQESWNLLITRAVRALPATARPRK